MGKSRNFTGENFWARGYFVSMVGLDEEMVREYIRHQEKEDEHYDQLKLGMSMPPLGGANSCPFEGLTVISLRLCRR
ncbi:Transposase IS200 like [Nitrosomonas sp. Nm34]|nr:Transposase IS200 like [Nitrosomonas sp. Nm34]